MISIKLTRIYFELDRLPIPPNLLHHKICITKAFTFVHEGFGFTENENCLLRTQIESFSYLDYHLLQTVMGGY